MSWWKRSEEKEAPSNPYKGQSQVTILLSSGDSFFVQFSSEEEAKRGVSALCQSIESEKLFHFYKGGFVCCDDVVAAYITTY
jgi:hypothetical protein